MKRINNENRQGGSSSQNSSLSTVFEIMNFKREADSSEN